MKLQSVSTATNLLANAIFAKPTKLEALPRQAAETITKTLQHLGIKVQGNEPIELTRRSLLYFPYDQYSIEIQPQAKQCVGLAEQLKGKKLSLTYDHNQDRVLACRAAIDIGDACKLSGSPILEALMENFHHRFSNTRDEGKIFLGPTFAEFDLRSKSPTIKSVDVHYQINKYLRDGGCEIDKCCLSINPNQSLEVPLPRPDQLSQKIFTGGVSNSQITADCLDWTKAKAFDLSAYEKKLSYKEEVLILVPIAEGLTYQPRYHAHFDSRCHAGPEQPTHIAILCARPGANGIYEVRNDFPFRLDHQMPE